MKDLAQKKWRIRSNWSLQDKSIWRHRWSNERKEHVAEINSEYSLMKGEG